MFCLNCNRKVSAFKVTPFKLSLIQNFPWPSLASIQNFIPLICLCRIEGKANHWPQQKCVCSTAIPLYGIILTFASFVRIKRSILMYQSLKHQKIGPFNPKNWGLSVVCMRERASVKAPSSLAFRFVLKPLLPHFKQHTVVAMSNGGATFSFAIISSVNNVLSFRAQRSFVLRPIFGAAGQAGCYSGLFKLTAGDERAYSSSTTANRSLGKQEYAVRYMRGCFSM